MNFDRYLQKAEDLLWRVRIIACKCDYMHSRHTGGFNVFGRIWMGVFGLLSEAVATLRFIIYG